jgi:general secretion pathway protein A
MYNDYFGLKEPPFSIAPNPQYLFMSPRHREALAHLLYGIQSDGGFILLTGEVGTGKTTVCRCLLEQIPEDVDTAYILNPKQTAQELLATACDEFGVEYPEDASIKVLVDVLNRFLLEAHQQGRKTVLIIDEAQNLSVDVLEQLRLLTNLETNQRKLLQIILLGQPELLTLLARQELRQLSQRVTARFHLDALNRDEVASYIQHRLDTAGAKGSLFPAASVKRIFQISKGIPRLINLVCDRALLGTYVQNKLQVDVPTVNHAAKEILGPAEQNNQRWLIAIAATVVLGIAGYVGLSLLQQEPVAPAVAQVETQTAEPETSERAPVAYATQGDNVDNTIVTTEPEIQEPQVAIAQIADTGLEGTGIEGDLIEREEIDTPVIENPETQLSAEELSTAANNRVSVLIRTVDIDQATGFSSQQDAFEALLQIWGIDAVLSQQSDPCEVAAVSGLQCLSRLGSLRDISHMNRPVVINLTTNQRSQWFLLTGVDADSVQVTANARSYTLSSKQMLSAWSGYYTLLWRTPPAYREPAKLGDQGAAIDWLQTQLTFVEGADPPSIIEGTRFDSDLESRVKRFQISVGLIPDGIVGPQTWIHLNSADASNIPKLN